MANSRSGFGTVAVWLAVAIIAIALFAMLATHVSGWLSWGALGLAAAIAVVILIGGITTQAHFIALFGTIGIAIIIIAAFMKGCAG